MNNTCNMGTLAGVTIARTQFCDGGACYTVSFDNSVGTYKSKTLALKTFIGLVMSRMVEECFDYDDLAVILSIINPDLID